MPTWTNAVSGDWGTSGNWTGGVPNAVGASAIFNNLGLGGSDLSINLGGVTRTVGALTLNAFPFVAYVLRNGTLNMQSSTGFAEITANVQNASNNNPMGWNSTVTLQLTTGTIVTTQAAASLIFGGAITGSGTLNKAGAGILQLDGANSTRTGNTVISEGTVNLNATNALGSGRLDVDGTTARLELLGFSQSTGALLSSSGGVINNSSATAATLTLNQTASGFYQGTISGAINLVKNGTDLLALQAQNTCTGTTTVNAGTLSLQHLNAISGSSVVTVNTGGTLSVDIANTNIRGLEGAGSVTSALLASATLTIAGGNGGNFSGAITNGIGSPLAMDFNAGVTYLSGNGNTYTGGTTISGGTVVIGVGGTTGSIGTGTVTINGGTFGLFRSGDFTFANAVAGAGTFEKNLGGIVTLTGNNSGFTGTLNVNGGTLRGSDANSFGNGAALHINSGATLDLNNGAHATTFYFRSLSGGGTLQNMTDEFTNVKITQTVNTTFSGVIADSGRRDISVEKLGAGTLTLSGVNTFSGEVFLTGGTIALSGAGSISSASILAVLTGSTFDISGISAASTSIKDLGGDGGSVVLGGKTLNMVAQRDQAQNLTFIGSAGTDQVNFTLSDFYNTFDGSIFDLSRYTLSNWTDGTDFFTLTGNGDANTLRGTNIRDVINGASGNDIIDGRGGNDTLNGDAGDDTIDGSAGNDNINGGNNNDTLRGGADNDTINGDAGADTIDGGTGADVINGGAGDDLIYYDSADPFSIVFGGADNDTLIISGGSVPTHLNLVAQGFETARHVQTDTTGQPWQFITETYNTTWQLLSTDRINDDNSRRVTTYDRANAQTWDFSEEDYNTAGARVELRTYYDDNTRRTTGYDATSAQPYATYEEDYNVAGQRTALRTYYDDGTRRTTGYDTTSQTWSTYEEDYNLAGQRVALRTYNDDGTRRTTQWDPANGQTWSLIEEYYNAAGQRTRQITDYDDGVANRARLDTVWDVGNTQAWAVQTTQTSNVSVVVRVYGTMDNGSAFG